MKNFLREFWLVFKDFFTNFIFKKLTIQLLIFQFFIYCFALLIAGVLLFNITILFFVQCIIFSLILLFIEILLLITMMSIQNLKNKTKYGN